MLTKEQIDEKLQQFCEVKYKRLQRKDHSKITDEDTFILSYSYEDMDEDEEYDDRMYNTTYAKYELKPIESHCDHCDRMVTNLKHRIKIDEKKLSRRCLNCDKTIS